MKFSKIIKDGAEELGRNIIVFLQVGVFARAYSHQKGTGELRNRSMKC